MQEPKNILISTRTTTTTATTYNLDLLIFAFLLNFYDLSMNDRRFQHALDTGDNITFCAELNLTTALAAAVAAARSPAGPSPSFAHKGTGFF